MAKKTPEINATSTADIAFLLLVFFLPLIFAVNFVIFC